MTAAVLDTRPAAEAVASCWAVAHDHGGYLWGGNPFDGDCYWGDLRGALLFDTAHQAAAAIAALVDLFGPVPCRAVPV